MNKDEAREAAYLKAMEDGILTGGMRHDFLTGFDAGAASVDRRAIVEEAFEKLKVDLMEQVQRHPQIRRDGRNLK